VTCVLERAESVSKGPGVGQVFVLSHQPAMTERAHNSGWHCCRKHTGSSCCQLSSPALGWGTLCFRCGAGDRQICDNSYRLHGSKREYGTAQPDVGGYLEANTLPHVALTWWLGDLAGALVVTPVVLLWARNPTWRLSWENWTSIALSYVGAVGVGLIAFSPLIPKVPIRDLLGFLAVLPLLWAGLRLDPRHTANIALILSGFAIWGTFRNGGPFATANLNDSFLLLLSASRFHRLL
jgi:MASE1